MLLLIFLTLSLQFFCSNSQALDANGLDSNGISLAEKVLAIERLMLTPGTIDFQVAPCEFVLNGPPPGWPDQPGDQTAAQWVRIVFHDFITANVTAGTGGIDASIGFESDRPENLGFVFPHENFINRTIVGFNLFSNVFISTSDFIALGIAEAVLSCDSTASMLKLRAGRIDTKTAGPFGVPEPTDHISVQKATFSNAGFSETEMIQAVACGHSIGGVHTANFPSIVNEDPTYGTSGVDYFDSTPFVFDNVGLQSYISSTGKSGGPLVTSSNSAAQSDRRIFSLDNNATVAAMAASEKAFQETCYTIFEKMIDTVPKGTTLSDVIGPREWITMDSYLDLDPVTGRVSYQGTIRTWSHSEVPATASYFYGTVGGGNTGPKTSNVGVLQSNIIDHAENDTLGLSFTAYRFPFFGNTTFYKFSDIISDPKTNSFNIGSVYSEPINLSLFVVPSLSFVDFGAGPKVLVRAAYLTALINRDTKPLATLYYATLQNGSKAPLYKQASATLSPYTTIGAYTIYEGTIVQPNDTPADGGGGSHVDVVVGKLRSAKAQVNAAIGKSLFTACGEVDLTLCS